MLSSHQLTAYTVSCRRGRRHRYKSASLRLSPPPHVTTLRAAILSLYLTSLRLEDDLFDLTLANYEKQV
ncbi:hypothetical protein TSMEX_006970 [Taenia solium]|eukprot:TsM_001174500 transcript=TsM_001174500 gene=TsM_001174500